MSTIVSSWTISAVDREKRRDVTYNVSLLVLTLLRIASVTIKLSNYYVSIYVYLSLRQNIQFVWVSVQFDMPREDLTESCIRRTWPCLRSYWMSNRWRLSACLNLSLFSSFHAAFYYFKPHVIKTAPGKATLGERLL